MNKLILLFLAIASSSLALSLKESIDHALKNNPKIAQYKYEYEVAKKDLQEIKSKFLPSLSVNANVAKHRENNDDSNYKDIDYNSHSVTLQARQNIYNGNADLNEYRKREHLREAARYKYLEIVNSTVHQVIESYIDLLKKKEILDITKETYKIHEEILQKSIEREESGIDVSSELEKVKSRKVLANVNLLSDRNNFYDALYALESVINGKINVQKLFLPSFSYKMPSSVDKILNKAYKNNPTIRVNRHNIEALKYDKKIANKGFLPTVDLEVTKTFEKKYDGKKEDNDDLSVMLTAEYNIFNGGADMIAKEKAMVSIIREEQTYKNSMRLINEGVNIAFMKRDILQKQLPLLQEYNKSTKTIVESYEEEFDLGRRTIIDLLDVKDTYQSSKVKYAETKYSLENTKYRLLNYIGDSVGIFNLSIYK
jgi:adhesin transport system outer membrane protein